jgi:hypothetical protein
MLIENKTENVIMFSGKFMPTSIAPGMAEISKEQYAAGKDHIDRLVKADKLAIVQTLDANSKQGPAQSLADLKNKDAELVVQKCFSLSQLEAWKESELRESVRLAIMKRIEFIEGNGKSKK